PVVDYWCFAMSLPLRFAADPTNIPARLPYMRAPADRIARWSTRLPQAGLRVGLVWKGSAFHANDQWRSLPGLETLAPLWQIPGVIFVSLQKGAGEEEARDPPPTQPLVALGHETGDFADAAAIVESLDLVIRVDTAIG